MTDYSELKRLAEAANAVTSDVNVEMTLASESGPNQAEIDAVTAFMGMATPAAVLALIAENERLKKFEEWFGRLETCNNSLAESFRAERDQLKAENAGIKTGYEAYEQVVRGLKAEVEALRKALVDWQEVVAAVKREVPERFTSHARGNAPGHGHSISGVWDDDNGALAGKECAWCKAWNTAMGKGEQS